MARYLEIAFIEQYLEPRNKHGISVRKQSIFLASSKDKANNNVQEKPPSKEILQDVVNFFLEYLMPKICFSWKTDQVRSSNLFRNVIHVTDIALGMLLLHTMTLYNWDDKRKKKKILTQNLIVNIYNKVNNRLMETLYNKGETTVSRIDNITKSELIDNTFTNESKLIIPKQEYETNTMFNQNEWQQYGVASSNSEEFINFNEFEKEYYMNRNDIFSSDKGHSKNNSNNNNKKNKVDKETVLKLDTSAWMP